MKHISTSKADNPLRIKYREKNLQINDTKKYRGVAILTYKIDFTQKKKDREGYISQESLSIWSLNTAVLRPKFKSNHMYKSNITKA